MFLLSWKQRRRRRGDGGGGREWKTEDSRWRCVVFCRTTTMNDFVVD